MAFCAQCGNNNSDGATICSKCGAQLVPGSPDQTAGFSEKTQNMDTTRFASQNQPNSNSGYPGYSGYPGQYPPAASSYPTMGSPSRLPITRHPVPPCQLSLSASWRQLSLAGSHGGCALGTEKSPTDNRVGECAGHSVSGDGGSIALQLWFGIL